MQDILLTSQMSVNSVQNVGGDNMVVAAAKVSTDADEAMQYALDEFQDNNRGLINYLMKHRHGSPFEHGQLTVFADVPIFVWREWHRHRIWSFNEESARYSALSPIFWVPEPRRGVAKAPNYKAARPQFEPVSPHDMKNIHKKMMHAYAYAWEAYSQLMDQNYAPEVARAVLPVGIYSKGWATANPRAIMDFLSKRTHDKEAQFVSYPQAEIETVARKIEEVFAVLWPITYECFVKNGRVAP